MDFFGTYFCSIILQVYLILFLTSRAERSDVDWRNSTWSQTFRIYKYDCKHDYSICSRQNTLLQLVGTFDNNLDSTVRRVCDPIVDYIEHYDCAIFLRKIESRWLNFYADSIMDKEIYKHYQIPSLESSEITNDFILSVYDAFKLIDDFKLCIVGPFAIQIANMVSLLFMGNTKATIRFFVPLEDFVPAEQYVALLRKPGGFRLEVMKINGLSECIASACCHALHIRDIIAEVETELLQSLSSSSVTVLLEQNLGFGLRSGAVDRALDMTKGWHLASSWYRGNTMVQVTRNSVGYEIVSPIMAILDSISPEQPMELRVRFGARPLMAQGQPSYDGRREAFPIIDLDESMTFADDLTKKGLPLVILITFNEPHFIETAYGLRGALRSLGYRRFILGPLSVYKYRRLLDDGENVLQIALGSHRSGILTRWYVVFHSENVFEPYIHLDRYQSVILNAVAVFVYSHSHLDFMHRLGRHDGIYLIPMYSQSVYYPYIASGAASSLSSPPSNATLTSSFHTPNDVMLVMSDSARRERFMDHFLQEANRHGVTVIRMMNVSNFNFFDVRTREFLAVSSKVVLNIHQDDDSALESHRINNMLALGKCIISERSVDPALDAEYERDNALIFADDLSEIFPLVRALLLDDRRRRELEVNAVRKYWKIQNDTRVLEIAMREIISILSF